MGYQSFRAGDGLMVGLPSKGPSVLLNAHLPQGESEK